MVTGQAKPSLEPWPTFRQQNILWHFHKICHN